VVNMKTSNLIKRTYRIRKDQDFLIKKKKIGESEQIRQSIDKNIKVEELKKKWQEDSKKWSKELQETIINNLFN